MNKTLAHQIVLAARRHAERGEEIPADIFGELNVIVMNRLLPDDLRQSANELLFVEAGA